MSIKNNLKKILIALFVLSVALMPLSNVLADTTTDVAKTLIGIDASIINGITSWITGAPADALTEQILNAIVGALTNVLCQLSKELLDLGAAVLKMAIDPKLVEWDATNITEGTDTYNPVVAVGWNATRNIANAALVIGLIVIAIRIILGFEEGKAKKTLINFILIALLINFTPVICGFIIDGCNIIMNSIVRNGIDPSFQNSVSSALETDNLLKGIGTDNVLVRLGVAMCIIIFAVVGFIIYILYALLFIARHMVLWLLVIASPIAFATKVFPQSKYLKMAFPSIFNWEEWWQNFIQWCVIGIPAGFSIFLSNIIMNNVATKAAAQATAVGSIMMFLTPLVFLVAGFFITVSAGGQIGAFVGGLATGAWAATGARAITAGKEKAAWAAGGLQRTATGAVIGTGSGIAEGYKSSGVTGAMGGAISGRVTGGLTQEGREKAAQRIATAKETIGWAKRGEYAASLSKDVGESQKRLSEFSDNDLEKLSVGIGGTRQRNIDKSAAFKELNKRGKLKTTQLDYLANNKGWADAYGVDLKEISKARPDYGSRLSGKTATEIVEGMNPKKAGETINSDAYADKEVISAVAGLNPNVLKGKLQKGNKKDIDNMRKGYIEILKDVPGLNGVAQSADPNDLQTFVNNNVYHTLIDNEIANLKKSTLAEDNNRGRALAKLSEHARLGEL